MADTNFESIVRDVLMSGETVTGRDGRLFLDGVMLQASISDAIAEAIYVGEIFRNGQSVTSKYAVNAKPLDSVRVPLETPFPSSSRTARVGVRPGTPGNDGIINKNAPMLPADDEFLIVLNQINDQSILFPELAQKATYVPLRDVARRIASYGRSVVEDRSASTLAEILAYNIYRSLNEGNNINNIDITAENAYSALLAQLNTKLSAGDPVMGAHTYGTQGRTIIARPQFINSAFSRTSGIILNGSDIAQNMLRNYKFSEDVDNRNFYGNAYRGNAMQFAFVEAADYIWTLAEKYLKLPAGSLDDVLGIAVSYEATAVSENIDYGVKIIDANETRGMKAQPLNCWGHEAFRKIQLIGTPDLDNDVFTTAGFTAEERRYPVAPKDVFTDDNSNKILVPIYGIGGAIVGYREVANLPKPSGGVVTGGAATVTLTLTGTGGATVNNATVTATSTDSEVTAVKNNNNGTYTFKVAQGATVTLSITASGYQADTVKLTAEQTAKKNVKITEALTAGS